MFRTFFWKIWLLGIFCSVFAICLVVLGLVSYHLKDDEEEMLQQNLLLTQIIAHEIESGYLKGLWPYKTLKMVSDDEDVLLLWIVKPNGEVFWANDPEMLGKIIQDPFLGTAETRDRNSYLQDEKFKLIAHPIKIELKEKPWTLFLGTSFKQLKKAQREMIFLGVGLLVLVAIFISFIIFYFARGITRPLKQLSRGAEIVGKGNLDYRITIKTGDEFEELGKVFNQMVKDLKIAREACAEIRKSLEVRVAARTRELQQLAGRLEEKAKERTKELETRINELERFHRLTVGRELRMVELKKALREIEEKLKKPKNQRAKELENINQQASLKETADKKR